MRLRFADIDFTASGSRWLHARSYDNLTAATSSGLDGAGWSNRFIPQLIVYEDGALLVYGPGKVHHFDLTEQLGPTYEARFHFKDTFFLGVNSPQDRYEVSTSKGRTYLFQLTPTVAGNRFIGMIEPDGSIVAVGYASPADRHVQSISRGVSGQMTGLFYTYHPGSGLVATVRLRVNGVEIREAKYFYYSSGEGGGASRDLKHVQIFRLNPAPGAPPELMGESHYRYYTGPSADGFLHGLKYVVGPEAFAQITRTGANPLTASDAVLAGYADNFFTYDSQQRVSLERVRGGARSYSFAYSVNLRPLPQEESFFNAWRKKTVVTMNDGTQEIVYGNPHGQTMLKILRSHEGEWCQGWRYDDDARAVQRAEPSAIAGYDEDEAALFTLHLGQGQLRNTVYGDGGRIQSISVQEGKDGTPVLLQERTYLARAVAGHARYYLEEDTRHVGAPGSGETAVTSYAYQFHGATTVVSSRTTTFPVVPVGQNGSGQPDSVVETFDPQGRRLTLVDERGCIQRWTLDPLFGSVSEHIVDFRLLPTQTDRLHLITTYSFDAEGRVTRELGPEHSIDLSGVLTSIRRALWLAYREINGAGVSQELSATGYVRTAISNDPGILINPVSITTVDRAGRVVAQIEARAGGADTIPGPLTASFLFVLPACSRWSTKTFNARSELVAERLYHEIPSFGEGVAGTHYALTVHGYDARSRRIVTTSPLGTIERTVRDSRGLPIQRWIGTNASQATPADPSGGGAAGNDMVVVEAREYDRGATGGDSLLTETIAFAGSGEARVTTFDYDFRGRRIVARGECGFRETYLYDNFDRVTEKERWSDAGVPPARIAKSATFYDARGRVYRTVEYAVDPLTGEAPEATAIASDRWFDASGLLVKRRNPEGAGFEKLAYDRVRRLKARYAGHNAVAASYAEAQTVASDTILEQTTFELDAAGNVSKEIRRERYHDTTGWGELAEPGSATRKARVLYTMFYPDALGRIVASANYGTNNGGASGLSATIPARSATVLLTSHRYNARGELAETTDPNGVITAQSFDAAGRLTQTVENSSSGPAAPDVRKTTDFTYTAEGQLATLCARNAVTGDQFTRWHYGTTLADSGVASRSLLRAKVYPDSDDTGPGADGPDGTYDRVEYRYNRLGEMIAQQDQNGTAHAYTYDKRGRLLHDRVTALGADIDGAIRRISHGYDRAERLASVTSWSQPAPDAGDAVNQVLWRFNAFGKIVAEYQSHEGAVDLSRTPAVRYTYADGANRRTRRTSTIYPDGRQIVLNHGASGSTDDALGRVREMRDARDADRVLARYTRRGLSATMRIEYPQPGIELTYLRQSGQSGGDPNDPYVGQDRFNRITDLRWLRTGAPGDYVDRIQYGFDAAGNRLWRRNAAAGADWDELYEYDGLSQLKRRRRGTLNGAASDLTGVVQDEEIFTYDPTGNWERYQALAAGQPPLDQTRTHNPANEIQSIVGIPDAAIHDRAGNMIAAPIPGAWEHRYRLDWDAWNRLVRVWIIREIVPQPVGPELPDWLVATYRYDGLTRRIWKDAPEDPYGSSAAIRRHFYYSDQWQVLEERLGTEDRTERQFIWGQRYIDDLILRETFPPPDADPDPESSSSSSTSDPEPAVPARLYATHDQWHVIGIVAADGTVIERFGYRAFGANQFQAANFQPSPDSPARWETLFGAYRFDWETALNAVRYRSLHPTLGRWLSRDPLQDAELEEGANVYGYVRNAPTSFADTMGLRCPCGEAVTAAATVGGRDALKARELADEALREAERLAPTLPGGSGGLRNGAADAFRHCFWSCRMSQELYEGARDAEDIGDIHEACNPNPPGEEAMDQHNNSIGRSIASKHGADCRSGCLGALTGGHLQTTPGGTPPRNRY